MKVVNTVDLKNKTNALLREVMNGEPIIITVRGKPAAALGPLKEEDLEDFILEHSPKVKRLIEQAEADRKAGRVIPFSHYLAQLEKKRG